MSSQQHNDYYRALLLNNIGVSLLHQGQDKPALATLKDSLQAMNHIFRQGSASFDVARKLQKARKRATKAGLLVSPQTIEAPLSFREGRIALQEGTEFSRRALRLVLIEVPEKACYFQVVGRDPELETAVILNNLALSYHMLASSRTESPIVSVELTDHALHLCNMASTVVTSRFVMCEAADDESRAMSVALILTGNTKLICNENGRVSDAESCDKKFQRISGAVQLSPSGFTAIAPSA